MDNPLDAVFAYAEQAYIRMQAGDILIRCLDQGTVEPMRELVEGLVLAGPQSLGTLSEVLAETGQRRAQIQDDLQRVYGELQNDLRKRGVRFTSGLPDAISFTRLTPIRFLMLLQKQGVTDEDIQNQCLGKLEETREMMDSLAGHLFLLKEIENFLRDWIWGLAHQTMRESHTLYRSTTKNWTL